MTSYEEQVMKVTTYGVAGSGLAINSWLPALGDVSAFAATMVPIASLIWLALQIFNGIRKFWKPEVK